MRMIRKGRQSKQKKGIGAQGVCIEKKGGGAVRRKKIANKQRAGDKEQQ